MDHAQNIDQSLNVTHKLALGLQLICVFTHQSMRLATWFRVVPEINTGEFGDCFSLQCRLLGYNSQQGLELIHKFFGITDDWLEGKVIFGPVFFLYNILV